MNDDDLQAQVRHLAAWADAQPSRVTAQTVLAARAAGSARAPRRPHPAWAVVVTAVAMVAVVGFALVRLAPGTTQTQELVQGVAAASSGGPLPAAVAGGPSPSTGRPSPSPPSADAGRASGVATASPTRPSRPSRTPTRTLGPGTTTAAQPGVSGSGPAPMPSYPADLVPGRHVALQPANYPTYLVRHYAWVARIDPVSPSSPAIDRADASFVVRAGLRTGAGVSFESVNYPGYYLRMDGAAVTLSQDDGTAASRERATFVAQSGLDGRGTSFSLWGNPVLYLRHQNFALHAQPDDGTGLFADDATFVVIPAPA